MNNISLVGRLGKDPETKTTASGSPVTMFSLGVDRISKDKQREVDWIDCTAWGKTGEVIQSWCKKGHRIGVTGSLQTRSWKTDDGQNRKVYFVLVDKVEFLESAKSGQNNSDDMPFET